MNLRKNYGWKIKPYRNIYTKQKRRLVDEKILKPVVLSKKIQPQDAHAAENYDWRYLDRSNLHEGKGKWVKVRGAICIPFNSSPHNLQLHPSAINSSSPSYTFQQPADFHRCRI